MTALRSVAVTVGVVALGLGWFDRLPLDRIGPWLYGETAWAWLWGGGDE